MEQLLAVIAKTERPLVNVIEVSGLLALHHTDNIMQVLPVLLTQTMKYLPEATDDQIRQALTITLGQYCDSVLEYLSVSQDALATWNTVLELLSPHTCTAVDIILTTWVPNTKETVVSFTALFVC
ncbi:hypothetical protein FGIG_04862 [Fasciola gigantica]|uniref:MROH2B-like N-terminal HEAT-repeats domain-containing protein n=1 Tax=Fasciola gigantica TaxID=46835 RepID=A0A504Y867_FASGI|nr:hypothetical protein FGIG_04862 [Fasciola gigantica]